MKLRLLPGSKQCGLSLIGFLFVLAVVAVVAVFGMKVVPTAIEYVAIKKAIKTAAASATSARDIQMSFDKQSEVNYIDSVSGKDLEITKIADGFEVNVEYQKKIPLFGPASLVIDYVASNVDDVMKKKQE